MKVQGFHIQISGSLEDVASIITLFKRPDQSLISFFLFIYLFNLILVTPGLSCSMRDLFSCGMRDIYFHFSCGMRDVVPWSGIEPGPLELGARTLNHGTTREVPLISSESRSRQKLSLGGCTVLLWHIVKSPLVFHSILVTNIQPNSFSLCSGHT